MQLDRRAILKMMAASGGAMLMPSLVHAAAPAPLIQPDDFRSLSMKNLHTGERDVFEYVQNGKYAPDAVAAINKMLRDHRTGDVSDMDVRLIEGIYQLQQKVGNDGQLEIISGYRSPKTNAMLAGKSGGVAKKSYHMKGMAVDINLPGTQLSHLHKAAKELKVGGVGVYHKSGFMHMDTGPVRYW